VPPLAREPTDSCAALNAEVGSRRNGNPTLEQSAMSIIES
jgi:hypothetical protein